MHIGGAFLLELSIDVFTEIMHVLKARDTLTEFAKSDLVALVEHSAVTSTRCLFGGISRYVWPIMSISALFGLRLGV